MDIGIDRKQLKGKIGIHIHYYTSQSAKVYSIEPHEFEGPIAAEKLCIKLFTDTSFRFDDKEPANGDSEHVAVINPGSLHLFQLWDCDSRQYVAPNDDITLTDIVSSREFVLRIRFKYPPSLEKQNFSDVWDSSAFYYYFIQCRHDFIHDILHDIYHSHIKVDLCIGLALVDMARVAFEKHLDLKQLKDKYEYHAFLPRHLARKTRSPIVRWQLSKTADSALEETFESFYCTGKNPHRTSIVSYLKQLLPSVPEYASEEFTIKNHESRSEKLLVHPYSHKQAEIYLDLGKNNVEIIGAFADLTAIDLRETNVLLHFTNCRPQHLEFADVCQARSFVAMLDGYYRLMYDYHYSLSNQIYSPIVKLWNELKCYGPLSLHGHSKDSPHKDYLKVIWRKNASSVGEGSFLIKQRSSSFTDYVMIVHKMGRNLPAIPIVYNQSTNSYSCDEYTMRQLFESQHRELSFSTVRELIRYYRSGDFQNLKLTTQLSPGPKEEIPLMVCRNRNFQRIDALSAPSIDLQAMETPVLLTVYDIQLGKTVHVSQMFELMEGTYGREKVLIRQVKGNVQNREALTLCFQRDVQKIIKWRHGTIVRLYGICLSPFYVMSQRLEIGRLDHLLKKRGSMFQLYHCIQSTGQLAQALVYLASEGFTHGAIRCKSVLVSSFDSHGDVEVKLAGDMMASYMSSLPLTDKLNVERLPWIALERWTNLANETTESDVYSFGMTIWEIFSHGEKPLSTLHSIDQVKVFIESGRDIQVPSTIEAFKATLHTYSDRSAEEQYNSLMNVVYQRIIVNNISADPSGRMKPQDIVRELILLNCLFTPNAYDPLSPINSSTNASSSKGQLTSSNSTNGQLSEADHSHTNSHHLLSERPLPNIPLPTPPAHIISSFDLIGFADRSAHKIGQGYYGEVYLCRLKQGNGKPPIKCAVKKLISKAQDNESNEKEIKEFERELKLMVALEHKNIVRMYGECFYTFNDGKDSRLIVMEYIQCGSLCDFVKSQSVRNLPADERLHVYKKFALNIAEGMHYLHSRHEGIIHRDLAARNVLITETPHTAKITDFGLARILSDKEYYRGALSSILPLLWCAPECLNTRKFTKASDVWSYAVLLWEMFSGGKRPCIDAVQTKPRADGSLEIDVESLIRLLNSSTPNSRLPKLPELSAELYELMMKCWQTEPSKRPTFESIQAQLQTIIR